MAETFLSPVIEKLLQLLTNKAAKKTLEGSVQSDVNRLKEELEIIQPLLKDADMKYLETGDVASEATKAWVRQVREKADRIEDVVDEYLRYEGGEDRDHDRHGKPRYDIASEIRDIKDSLCGIKRSSSKTPNVARHDVVGIGAEKKRLITWLTEGDLTRSVISLVGQGGIGKTTLAWKVYDDEVVKGHFDCRAWITVSQSFDAKTILRIMTSQICLAGERIEEDSTVDELISHLKQHLEAKRYVIVFDDVCEENFWEVIKHVLPESNKSSRIIVTTRDAKIAASCNENSRDYVQELKPWSPEMAFELFCKKAFGNDELFEGNYSEGFKQLCGEIISKCQGLPCIVSTVARLLSTKERVFEWTRVLDILGAENGKKALSLMSYFDLPYHLKTCLLYFVIFPQGHRIYDTTLYGLWIADGLVKAREGKTLEEVAEEYLDELIRRNLVAFQVIPGESKLCKVDSLLHEIISTRADELFFCQIWDQNRPRFVGKSSRLAIFGNPPQNVLETIDQNNELRSVFLFNSNSKRLTESFVVNLLKKFKLLKAVIFENTPLYQLPDEVGSLFHLSYLSLKYVPLKKLPGSIGKLRNLRSLDVRHTLVEELPIEINELRNLRHILAYYMAFDRLGGFRGVKLHEGFGCLENLQTLSLLEAHPNNIAYLAKELEKLKQLRWLDVCQLTAEIARALCASIAKMNRLERLCLASIGRDEILDIHDVPCSHHDLLWDVLLIGPLKTLPDWISRLQSLRSLVLQHTRLVDEPIRCIKDLTSLESLSVMHNAYDGEQLRFEEGVLEKLKSLNISGLKGLKTLKIEKGALPLVEVLLVVECPLLKKVETIEHLTNTKQLLVEIPQPIFQAGGSVNIEIKGTSLLTLFFF